MTHFTFLQVEWPAIFAASTKAEAAVHPDPRTACFYARRALELAVAWLYKHDSSLQLPYQDNLSALIHEPTFKALVGEAIFSKARIITRLGNQAVHSPKPIQQLDALAAARELFHVGYWLARTYAREARPEPGLTFSSETLPTAVPLPKQTITQLQRLETELRERDEKLSVLLADKSALDEELKRLRAEVTEARQAAQSQPDTHDYSEAKTRDYFIDLLLKEAGWPLDQEQDREYPVTGMPNNQGTGFVDYVLWGDDGKPLALVEAKRTRRDPRVGQQQAKLYADCLAEEFGRRPVIFYSNGYENWLWDDAGYPPRQVQGFYKKDELELLIQRRASRKPLAQAGIDGAIVERYYQTRAIRRIAESFEGDNDRKALLVMAGSGKTRTVIALCDLLMRCNWVKARVFLREHQDHITIYKLRMNKVLTATDLEELERMLVQSGIGGSGDIARAKEEFRGLGLFVRSLVGLDREAAKEALAAFLAGKTLAANQIEFLNLIVNHLTDHGVMNAGLLYESPFTDLSPQGPDGLFTSLQVDELMSLLGDVYAHAVA